MISRHMATMALLFPAASQFSAAQPPDVNRLLREVQVKYASLQTYSDVGEVRSTLTLSGPKALAQEIGPQQVPPIAFKMKLARFQMYNITWAQNITSVGQKGALWSDGGYSYFSMLGVQSEPKSTEEGFAGATGVSGGSARTLPAVFFDFSGNIIKEMSGAVLDADESIDGEDCYVVKSHAGQINRTLWISKSSKLILQVRTDILGDVALPHVSDFDLKNTLETFGQTLTDDEVRDMQAMIASVLNDTKANSSSLIETHREIKIDAPMTPEDFRLEPQAPAIPEAAPAAATLTQ